MRGLHFQKKPYEQTKLVRVVKGEILDVVVDLRKESKTYLKNISFKLSDTNKYQLLIPKGFAHGFLVLSEFAIVNYLVDEKYSKKHESGIIYNDPTLKIDWKIKNIIISEKDNSLKLLSQDDI